MAEFSYYALLVCTAIIGLAAIITTIVILARQLALSARMRRTVDAPNRIGGDD